MRRRSGGDYFPAQTSGRDVLRRGLEPELAELASKAKPRLLILYHYNGVTPEDLFNDMLTHYPGHFVIGRDLDIY